MYGQRLSLRDGKLLEDNLRGLQYYQGEHQLSANDSLRCAHALTLWLLAVGDIASCYCLERSYSMANLIRWSSRPKLDVKELLDDCKNCLATIRDYDPIMGHTGFRAYKAWLHQRMGNSAVYEFLRPLFYRLYGGKADVFRDLNTLLQFWSRLTLQDVDWIVDDAISSYLKLEDDMASWSYPETTLDCLRYIVTDWLRDFELDGLRPDFSNGATAEVKRGAGIAQKVFAGSRTIELAQADAMISFASPYFNQFTLSTGCAIWQQVPKGIDKKRGISMEPTVNQYYQYALFKGLDSYFHDHPEMGIDLENQDLSRDMCQKGSANCRYGTIDLSSASDTVTWPLVKTLLRDCPDLLRYIKLVRTPRVSINGKVITMVKYAPMGSSLCFPIECIVFAAIASYACWISGIPQNFRVYGDDIIIDCRAFQACVELLQLLHFEVNRDKSYGPVSHFLEACGMEAYYGYDVTPCRLSRKLDIIKLRQGVSPQQYEGALELANRFYDYGLFHCRRYFVADIMESYDSVPFSVNRELGIYHPNPTNNHCVRYWSRSLQCVMVRILRAKTNADKGPAVVRYYRTLEAIESRTVDCDPEYKVAVLQSEQRVQIRCGPTRSELRKEFVPLWSLLN